uniref:Nuclear receptor domain-containing protein n=1 Tax=Caenorhabditis japonica TaxID=281687 RepID=A0A8R1E1S6_CAEJA
MSTDLLYEYFYPPSDHFRSPFDDDDDVDENEKAGVCAAGSSDDTCLFDSSSFDLDFCVWENNSSSNSNSNSPPSEAPLDPLEEIDNAPYLTSEFLIIPTPPAPMPPPRTVTTSSTSTGSPICHVCASPTANTLHFGGRSCKACAAFFRRSVSMSMTYECIGSPNDTNPCKIHFELRMLCRHCRFIKCLEAGMRKELVQAKKEETRVAKRRSKGLVVVAKKNETDATYDEYVNAYTVVVQDTSSSTKPEPDSLEMSIPDSYLSPSSSSNTQPLDMTISLSPPPSAPSSIVLTPVVQTQRAHSQTPPFDPQQASTSQYYPIIELDNKIFELVEHYVRTEASLNDRRKIMYTDTQIRDVFDTTCECPYERYQLKPFNYKTFCGFVKHDFVMILDYVNQFPEFQSLLKNEKNAMYRMTCAVDAMLSSAYYTYRVGIDKKRLVLFNGEFMPMDPPPLRGDEPGAEKLFETVADHERYKTLMPLKLKQYYDMAIPFCQLEVSFEEYVLLKALTIWHISNYKHLSEGRAICARQREAIVQALHKVVEERGDEVPAIRVGQLLLSISYITRIFS